MRSPPMHQALQGRVLLTTLTALFAYISLWLLVTVRIVLTAAPALPWWLLRLGAGM